MVRMSRPWNLIVPAHVIHDGERHRGLAAAGLADDAVGLAGHQLQVEVHHGRNLAGAHEIRDTQIVAFKDGPHVAQGSFLLNLSGLRAAARRALRTV